MLVADTEQYKDDIYMIAEESMKQAIDRRL